MKKMKKFIALALALALMTAIVTGCSSESSSEDESSGSEKTKITVGITNDLATLGPYDASNMGSFHVSKMVYQGLFARNGFASTEMGPCIGKSYTVSDDGMSVTVEMFDYVKDSEGNDITADDVVFSFNCYKDTGLATTLYTYLDTVTKVDEYTVRFDYKDMKLGVIEDTLELYIVDSENYDEVGYLTNPVGTGPYVVTEFSPSSRIVFEKNEDFWQTDEQYIHAENVANADIVECQIILESAQVPIELQSGDIDLATQVSYANTRDFFMDEDGNAKEGYNIYTWDSQLIRNIAFNMSEESILSDNLALRQAICYAINNEELVEGVLQGAGTALHTYGTSVYGDYNDKWDSEDYYDYDVEKAKEKLAEAGYEPGEVKIKMISQTNDSFKKAMELIKEYLNVVGIELEIIQYDSALYSTYRTDFSQWDLLLDNQANSVAMASIWGTFLTYTYTEYNGVGRDFTGAHDEELYQLVKTANSIEGHTEENVDAVHYYIKDNVLVYGLWAEQNYAVSNDRINEICINSKLYVSPGPSVLAD